MVGVPPSLGYIPGPFTMKQRIIIINETVRVKKCSVTLAHTILFELQVYIEVYNICITGIEAMAMFRENFSSGMNYLRRRFSSDDLYRDGRDGDDPQTPPTPGRKLNMPNAPGFPSLSSVQGMTRGILSQAAAAASSAAANVTNAVAPQRVVFNKDHCKVLLIIDDKHNDW